ncbi:MAG: aryl-sulfate sulfotransferase [Candidatus Tectomicrobia bacterium]|nr:aryl-sulfate sulfotransferase [Candidatus Tectomicrobia bacterium]
MARRSFPRGVTLLNRAAVYEGYTLYATLGGSGTVYLVDVEGKAAHQWKMPYPPGNYGRLLDNGNLLYACRVPGALMEFGGKGGLLLEVDWQGREVWRYEDPAMHHDFSRMPNGNTVTLCREKVPAEKAALIRGGRPGTEDGGGAIWADVFREVTPAGEVAWEWHAHERLSFEEDVLCPLCPRHEWGHANAVLALPDGNLMTCFRLLNFVGIIDHGSGAWSWRWGKEELGHPHDPSRLENGNVLIFDNGLHNSDWPRSRVVEVNPQNNEIVWHYEDEPPFNFWSNFISGAQRLPNGNTLICEGMWGRLFEVTRAGEVVWEFYNPEYAPYRNFGPCNMVFRAYRYGPEHPALRGRLG